MTENGFQVTVKETNKDLIERVELEIRITGLNCTQSPSPNTRPETETWVRDFMEVRIKEKYTQRLLSYEQDGRLTFKKNEQDETKFDATGKYFVLLRPNLLESIELDGNRLYIDI